MARTFVKSTIASVPAGLLAYYGMGLVTANRKLEAVALCLVLLGVGGVVYFGFTKLLGMPEASAVVERFKRKRAAGKG